VAATLAYLDVREQGGYTRTTVRVTLRHDHTAYALHHAHYARLGHALPTHVDALLYTANEHNADYLGPAPLIDMARQMARARGPSGANAEYLFELGAFASLSARPLSMLTTRR